MIIIVRYPILLVGTEFDPDSFYLCVYRVMTIALANRAPQAVIYVCMYVTILVIYIESILPGHTDVSDRLLYYSVEGGYFTLNLLYTDYENGQFVTNEGWLTKGGN